MQLFKYILSVFLALLCMGQLAAQNWQQEVNYYIEVSLNDTAHTLNGLERVEYINNSPNELPFLYFHLWPNAYKNQSSAFAKQQLENGSARFYFSKSAERGFIDGLAFETDGKPITWEYDANNPDIAKLTLPKPLKSGEKITIQTPFTVKIPDSFSRLGHVGQSYQITQWYPKPAVYDAKGWHPMPYLDQGEFYSEFGSFEVKITLPQNYVVGATGQLQNPEEIAWLNQKVQETQQKKENFDEKDLQFPPSAATLKTLLYKQDRIHDFAWFADKRFHVLTDTVQLPGSTRKVTCWAMFTNQEANLWTQGAQYVADAVYFYSDKLGLYPYNHCTAVQSALSAGAGMEYPMITVIGKSGSAKALEQVILHEVGHNWFYGILASNERQHPWMDEGMNSYYEYRYFTEKYPDAKLIGNLANTGIGKLFDLADYKPSDLMYYLYLINARKNNDQAIEQPAATYTPINYGAIVYGKTAQAFTYLQAAIGTPTLDSIMHDYYRQFSFKHPYPQDVRSVFENKTGNLLNWFFDDMLGTTKKLDYKLVKVKPNAKTIGNNPYDLVTLKQNSKTGISAPFSITAFKNKQAVQTNWYNGFTGTSEVAFPSGSYDVIQVDALQNMPETNRRNNTLFTHKLFKRLDPLRLQPFGSLENPNRTQLFFAPAIGYNLYDKAMLGLAFYNSLVPVRPLQFTLVPMYAVGSNSFSGVGDIGWNIYPQKGLKHVELAISGATFGNGIFSVFSKDTSLTDRTLSKETYKFYRIAPRLALNFRNKNLRQSVNKQLLLRHVSVLRKEFECPPNTNCSNVPKDFYLNELSFSYKNTRRINPLGYSLTMQQGKEFALAQAEVKYLFSYGKRPGSGLSVRLFAAAFLQNNTVSTNAPVLLPLTMRGGYDYAIDQVFIGRNEPEGFWTHQVGAGSGGFKVPLSIGYTDKYLLAANFKAPLPILKLPLKLYADIGLPYTDIADGGLWSGKVFFDSGIAITPLPDAIEIYWSLLSSNNIKDTYELNGLKWYERITFLINFNALNPIKAVRNFNINF